jgi:hypothetical protein
MNTHHFGSKELTWWDHELYFKDKYLGKVITAAHGLWRIEWPDGIRSVDYYNLTRAKEHMINVGLKELNNAL